MNSDQVQFWFGLFGFCALLIAAGFLTGLWAAHKFFRYSLRRGSFMLVRVENPEPFTHGLSFASHDKSEVIN